MELTGVDVGAELVLVVVVIRSGRACGVAGRFFLKNFGGRGGRWQSRVAYRYGGRLGARRWPGREAGR